MLDKITLLNNANAQTRLWIAAQNDAVNTVLGEYKLCLALIEEMSEYLDTNNLTTITSGSIFHQMMKQRLE